jgi:hypothetical protein
MKVYARIISLGTCGALFALTASAVWEYPDAVQVAIFDIVRERCVDLFPEEFTHAKVRQWLPLAIAGETKLSEIRDTKDYSEARKLIEADSDMPTGTTVDQRLKS